MVSEQNTKKVHRELKNAGWTPGHKVGSHTKWHGPNGTTFSLPDGHKQISPGVYRNLLTAIQKDKER